MSDIVRIFWTEGTFSDFHKFFCKLKSQNIMKWDDNARNLKNAQGKH